MSTKKLPPYPAPELFHEFHYLVNRAKNNQRGSVTQRQYGKLLNIILSAQERTSLLIGWCAGNEKRLRQSLLEVGVTIRKDKIPAPSRYKTKENGFGRVVEIEQKIQKKKKRQGKNERLLMT